MRELIEAIQEDVRDLDIEDQIQSYVDKWERIKVHSQVQDVPGHKQFLKDLLTFALVKRTPISIVAQLQGISRQRVYQILRAFRHYQEGKGTFGY